MKITVFCDNELHPIIPRLKKWVHTANYNGHECVLINKKELLTGGDFLFLVSCGCLISESERRRYQNSLVIHASDLPRGRGWSPHIWSILNGANEITVSLLDAGEKVDSGQIWLKKSFLLEGHELLDEINEKLFEIEISMMDYACNKHQGISKVQQEADLVNYFRKRMPEDSRLNPFKTIAEQFNLLRVVDNERYPAFFELHGKRYVIHIKKEEGDS